MSSENEKEIKEVKEMNEENEVSLMQSKTEEEKSSLWVEVDNGTLIDLNCEYSWNEGLTNRQKLFCFWIGYPFSRAIGNAALAARLSGYASKSSKETASRMLKDPTIMKQIQRIQDESLGDDGKKYIKRRNSNVLKRMYDILDMDVTSYYEDISDENGETRTRPKPLSDLTKEQRSLIEGISFDAKGNPIYKFSSKIAIIKELLQLNKDYNPPAKEESDGGFNVSTVYDLIKGKIETKVEEIKKRREDDDSDFKETPPAALLQTER